MGAEAGAQERLGIGARLRAGRERLGLTVLQAAERLHVDARILEALEAEDFEALGAPVFVRGHIRRYAEAVGEAAADLQRLYGESGRAAAPPDLTRIPRSGRAADPRALLVPALVVLIGFTIAGGVWWVLTGAEPPRRGAESGADGAAASGAVARAPVTGRGPPAAPPPPVTAAVHEPQAEPARIREVALAELAAEPAAAGARVELALRFAEDCWVEIYDGGGRQLFFDIGAAGSGRRVSGTAPLRVLLGNAPAVELQVNGEPAAIPPEARRNRTARLTVDAAGRLAPAARANGG